MIRANNFVKNPNVTGSSANGKGRTIVPIFANKKKRLKQALYANPNMDDFTVNEGMDEIESLDHSLYPEESGYFETESFEKDSLGYPSFRKRQDDPSIKKIQDKNTARPNVLTATPSYPSQATYRNSLATTKIAKGNNRGGKENNVRENSNSVSYIEASKWISTSRQNFTAYNSSNIKRSPNQLTGHQLPTLPPPRGSQQNGIKKPVAKFNSVSMASANGEFGSNTCNQNQSLTPSKASSTQVNMMSAEPTKSLIFITGSTNNIQKWTEYRDQLPLIFEVFGILDSQVSMNANGNGRNFVVKDNTGILRCTFWEMDRKLPRLTRGQMIRCVGNLDRQSKVFHCVSVRPIRPPEQKLVTASITASEKALQESLLAPGGN